jgi:hypothetical protein
MFTMTALLPSFAGVVFIHILLCSTVTAFNLPSIFQLPAFVTTKPLAEVSDAISSQNVQQSYINSHIIFDFLRTDEGATTTSYFVHCQREKSFTGDTTNSVGYCTSTGDNCTSKFYFAVGSSRSAGFGWSVVFAIHFT